MQEIANPCALECMLWISTCKDCRLAAVQKEHAQSLAESRKWSPACCESRLGSAERLVHGYPRSCSHWRCAGLHGTREHGWAGLPQSAAGPASSQYACPHGKAHSPAEHRRMSHGHLRCLDGSDSSAWMSSDEFCIMHAISRTYQCMMHVTCSMLLISRDTQADKHHLGSLQRAHGGEPLHWHAACC